MKIYNDYYYEDERLYSTGSDDLDDLLERAFCDGYEYAQKEFARRDYELLNEKGKEELKKIRNKIAKKLGENRKKINNTSNYKYFLEDGSNYGIPGGGVYVGTSPKLKHISKLGKYRVKEPTTLPPDAPWGLKNVSREITLADAENASKAAKAKLLKKKSLRK